MERRFSSAGLRAGSLRSKPADGIRLSIFRQRAVELGASRTHTRQKRIYLTITRSDVGTSESRQLRLGCIYRPRSGLLYYLAATHGKALFKRRLASRSLRSEPADGIRLSIFRQRAVELGASRTHTRQKRIYLIVKRMGRGETPNKRRRRDVSTTDRSAGLTDCVFLSCFLLCSTVFMSFCPKGI